MARRQVAQVERSPFKYKGDLNANLRPHEQCESEEEDGRHQVSPKTWPPTRKGHESGEPSLSLTCDLCGVNLVVYAGHATGELEGVRVLLPEGKKGKVSA